MYTPKEKHDPHADGRRILERVEQWKKDNPTPPISADAKSTEKRKKDAFTRPKGPALRKGVKVFRWNGISRDEGMVIKKVGEYLHVDWDGAEEKIEISDFKYQMRVTGTKEVVKKGRNCIESIVKWQWNAPSNEKDIPLVMKIEGDWEKFYNHKSECVVMSITKEAHKRAFWMLRPPYEFFIERGYFVTEDNANALQKLTGSDWANTCYWMEAACFEQKSIGDEVIKWLIGPLTELMDGKVILKSRILKFPAMDFGILVAAVMNKKITPTMGKEVLTRMHQGEDVDSVLEDDKYKVSSGDDMVEFVRKVIEDNPSQIADLKEGKDKILGWLVGQVMKESKGKANAGEVNKMFREELGL